MKPFEALGYAMSTMIEAGASQEVAENLLSVEMVNLAHRCRSYFADYGHDPKLAAAAKESLKRMTR